MDAVVLCAHCGAPLSRQARWRAVACSYCSALIPAPVRTIGGWQGAFRRGHPDAILLRYALAVVGPLDGLLVSHLDVFERGVPLRWCEAYDIDAGGERARIGGIVPGRAGDLEHQARLSAMLSDAIPRYRAAPISRAAQLIDELQALARLPVLLQARGPTWAQVTAPQDGCWR